MAPIVDDWVIGLIAFGLFVVGMLLNFVINPMLDKRHIKNKPKRPLIK